jgi:hypothetical protein
LARECAGDAALRSEVESLLACDPEAAAFLESPADTPPAADARAMRGLFPPNRTDWFAWLLWATAVAVVAAFAYAAWRLVSARLAFAAAVTTWCCSR